MDVSKEKQDPAASSKPIGIPRPGFPNDAPHSDHPNLAAHTQVKRFIEEESNSSQHDPTKQHVGSHHSNTSDEDPFLLPEGSPSFSAVMSELHIDLSHTHHVHEDHKLPISPLALSDHKHDPFHPETESTDSQSPPAVTSPTTPKKRLGSATSNEPRNRSLSWNYRNKMAADRRKQLQKLHIPQQSAPSSTHSSPLIIRKKNTASQPSTPQPVRLVPKYKILNENISVSHEDLVREQARERHLAEGFVEAKSIFHTSKFDRLGCSPGNSD